MCKLCEDTHVFNFFGREIPVDEVLLGSEVGKSSDRLDIDTCKRAKRVQTQCVSELAHCGAVSMTLLHGRQMPLTNALVALHHQTLLEHTEQAQRHGSRIHATVEIRRRGNGTIV